MRALGGAVLGLLLCAGIASGEESDDTPEQAADRVLAALRSGDRKALEALAEKDDPDPWLVAEELCHRGERDAAEAFATAAPHKDVEKLPAYLASRSEVKGEARTREALVKIRAAVESEDPATAISLLEQLGEVGTGVTAVELLRLHGRALRALGRPAESVRIFDEAARDACSLGWHRAHSRSCYESGLGAYRGNDLRTALARWQQARELDRARGDRRREAVDLRNVALAHKRLGERADALACLERAAALCRDLGDGAGVDDTLVRRQALYFELGNAAKALECSEKILETREATGDRAGAAWAHSGCAVALLRLGRPPAAKPHIEQALRIDRELGDRFRIASDLTLLGVVHIRVGEPDEALRCYEEALAFWEELGNDRSVRGTLDNIGTVYCRKGAHRRGLECLQRSLRLHEEAGDRGGAARVQHNLGNAYRVLGDYAKALAYQERAARLFREVGDRKGAGEGFPSRGAPHGDLGDHAKAREYYQRSLRINEELGDRLGIARTLHNLGVDHKCLGEYEKALEYYERSLRIQQDLENHADVAVILHSIGAAHAARNEYARALEYYQGSLRIKERLGDIGGLAATLNNVGDLHVANGDPTRAFDYYRRGLTLAREAAYRDALIHCLWGLARAHHLGGEHGEALQHARTAVGEMGGLVRGLADEEGARARVEWEGLFAVGAEAALARGDPESLSYFLESGRAISLLERLGGRARVAESLPEDLRREEETSRADEVAATRRLRAAISRGRIEEIRARRDALEAARRRTLDVVARIQRREKAAADLVFPTADSLAQIQAALGDDEALLTYGLYGKRGLVLVATVKSARIVRLTETREIEEVCRELSAPDPDTDPARAIRDLRRHIIEPLALDAKISRLLVSPHGAIAHVPFMLLVPRCIVVMVPSGTTYRALLPDRRLRGTSVLALGDPDYGVESESAAVTVWRSGAALAALPATREEVGAVGDVVLVGERATESTLAAALGEIERWRAVHLACHGLIRTDQPQLSSLALTPDERNDGFLTVLDVFRMKFPADLVVLSACETARGRDYRAEGVIGFTRAFMMAGAPRVIVSLWKVDDEATKALMVKFYELWKPGKVATATALKRAQEYVASHEKWKHPYYWAAWQLWGLPE